MPVTPTYPGVYIEEISSGVHTITGVATSIAAFFGRTAKGPINKAVRCLSMSDFNRVFGGPYPKSDLAQSVRMFFDNGGTDCYVVRLAAGAQSAAITLSSNTNAIGGATHNVLTAIAKTEGLWGNGLRLEVDYKTVNPDESFNFTVIQMEAGKEITREHHPALSMDPTTPRFAPNYVTQSSDLIDLKLHSDIAPPVPGPAGSGNITNINNGFPGYSQSRAFKTGPAPVDMTAFRTKFENILTNTPKFEMSVDEKQYVKIDLLTVLGPAPPAIVPGSPWSLSDMATRLQSVINTLLGAAIAGLQVRCEWKSSGNCSAFRITADSGDKRSVRIRRSADKDFAVPMMMGIDQGGIEVTRYSNFRPVPTGAFYHDPEKIIALSALTRGQITQIQIDTDPTIDNLDGLFTGLSPNSTDPWFEQTGGGTDGVREKLKVIANAVNASTTSKWKAEVWGYHLAFSSKEKDDASINRIPSRVVTTPDVLSGASPGPNFTRNNRQYALGITGNSPFQKPPTPPDKGDDGGAPTLAEFKGDESKQTGFHALDSIDLFNLMVIPADDEIPEATHKTLWGPASIYCQKHRAFLLMDAPAGWSKNGRPVVKDDTSLINDLRASIVKDYSAVFYPRLRFVDPNSGLKKLIGPTGAIAGLMARIDSTRGVWKAPAGIEADIRGIIGLEVKLTDMENGVLNKLAVNCLRAFPSGFVNWGARTMFGSDDDTSEWKYIPIRRLALFLEESLFRGTKWVVFEPNDEPLWSKIRLNVGAFMMRLFRQGAFQGSTPDKAFYVKCDAETTTQADRNLGIVNIEVGFAPLKPAEFVIIKIQQMAGEL